MGLGNYITSFPTLKEAIDFVDNSRQPTLRRAEIVVVSNGKLRQVARVNYNLFSAKWEVIDITPDVAKGE